MTYRPEYDVTMGFGNVRHRKEFLRYVSKAWHKIAEEMGDKMGQYYARSWLEKALAHVDQYGASC